MKDMGFNNVIISELSGITGASFILTQNSPLRVFGYFLGQSSPVLELLQFSHCTFVLQFEIFG